jgi:hypothetical protein
VSRELARLLSFDTAEATVYQVRLRHRHQEVQEVVPADYSRVMPTDPEDPQHPAGEEERLGLGAWENLKMLFRLQEHDPDAGEAGRWVSGGSTICSLPLSEGLAGPWLTASPGCCTNHIQLCSFIMLLLDFR